MEPKVTLFLSFSRWLSLLLQSTEGVFWDVIGTKILRLLLHAIHSHLHQLILLTFLGLEISYSST
jgi:hypothetical protein